jgi:hypothetical protein
MKIFFERAKHIISNAYFWQRLLVFLALAFAFGLTTRIEPFGIALLFFLATILSALWLVAELFRKKNSPVLGERPMKSWWVRLIAIATIAPLIGFSGLAIGVTASLAINPFSVEEIAAIEAREEAELKREQERKAAEELRKAEKAKFDADKAAAGKAAAEEQAKREAAEKAAAEEQAKREAEKKAADERAKAESEKKETTEATDNQDTAQDSTVDWARINKLKDSAPLLYATEFCGQTLLLLGVSIYDFVSPSDEGTALFISTKSGYNVDGNMVYSCISDQLNFSQALRANVGTTTALAGTKTWSENRMDFQWTYHPNNGINMSIIRERECFLIFCN